MSIARNSAIDATAQVFTVGLSLVSGIFVSRWLGSEGRGAYVLATIVAHGLLVNLANFGLRLACQVFIAKDRNRLASLNSLAMLISLGVGGIVSAALLIFAPWVQGVLFRGIAFQSLVVVAAAFPLMIYGAAWRGLMNGLGAIRARALFDVGFGASQSITIIAIILLWPGEAPIFPLIIAYYVIATGSTAFMVWLLRPHGRLWQWPSRALVGEVLAYGKWVFIGDMAARLRGELDQLLVNFAGGGAALGVYNQAASLAKRSNLLPEALTTASYQAIASSDSAESSRLVAAAFRQMLLIGIVLTLLGWICAPLIPIIYGADFAGAIWPFRVLVPAFCLMASVRVVAAYFSGHLMRPQIPMVINWIALAIQFGACYLLAAKLGVLRGITYGTAGAFTLASMAFLLVFVCRPETPRAVELVRFQRGDFARWGVLVKNAIRRKGSS